MAALILVVVGKTAGQRVALAVYGGTLVNMFGTSGAYHRLVWSPRAQPWIKALDHSAIYLLIAGTNTPVAALALDGPTRVVVLAGIWACTAVLVALRVTRIQGLEALFGAMYVVLGWAALPVLPQLWRSLPSASFWLIIAGGLLYTGGALVLRRNKPNPVPEVFGYHEVWHVAMTTGALCHYLAILFLTLSLR